jgi:hypothetical protein
MDFARLARDLGGAQLPSEPGGRAELAPFVLAGAPEIRVFPELEEGACVGAVFAALRPDTAEVPAIVLRAEEALDRGGKTLGINRELQLGDREFDDTVYVLSEAPDELLRRVLATPAVRDSARALVRGVAGEVRLGEGRVTIQVDAAQLEEAALPAVREAIGQLRALAGALAVPKDMPTRAELVRRRPVGHIFGLAAAWLVTLALAVVLRPPQVLAWGPVFAALGLGVGLWLAVCVGLALVLRGAADSLRWLVLSAGLFLTTTPFAGMALALHANATLDGGAAVVARHPVRVLDRGETRIVLEIAGLAGEERAVLTVPMNMVEGTLPKELESVELTTRPGALGWAWLAGLRP